ncbi:MULTISPECIES: sporulation integral membrane protein YlbJ [Pontibacillus]|uniref:Sporulation integral membrane protein YlbJ n=1 Tax=Pontibacillus chungwhensis TaxID=265426 RepID=A0ABY8V1P1_9BACI|nr:MULTISPECIES: sporulation integral membrane protein YlbJ [Pontibacillus]MCD5322570.1 sporulation integral membrane protein YlbJ [Pontibacillus sp. HN14]WIF99855.1 sporulation integral membrane protein YlbJ [Pontibacillus chungwhensis]
MKSQVKSLALALLALFLAFSLIRFPDQALEASIRGLNMWWEIVFPSLLPFFITAELLIGFGVVRFIGILFEPIMRPIFKVPGVGSFVWAMGMASGYPSGAKLTARLRQEKQLTRIEAERLVSFTNASNPLFIFGAVSVGFFHDPTLGVLLAACHYVGNTLVGICMRFYGRENPAEEEGNETREKITLKKAFQALHQSRLEEPRPFGKFFGDAVLSSIQTLLMIGGFIIMFSVFNKLLFLVGITPIIAGAIGILFQMLTLPQELTIPFISGLFEITLGSQMTAQAENAVLLQQVICVSFILAFNGFSVQAQVASILADTDIRFRPYFLARILHGLFAAMLSVLLFIPLYVDRQAFESNESPVWIRLSQHESFWSELFEKLVSIGPLLTIGSLAMASLILYRRMIKK